MIDWKKYDPESPPELEKEYLVSDGECVDVARINNFFPDEDKFPTWYPPDMSPLYHEAITHYAEINLPVA